MDRDLTTTPTTPDRPTTPSGAQALRWAQDFTECLSGQHGITWRSHAEKFLRDGIDVRTGQEWKAWRDARSWWLERDTLGA